MLQDQDATKEILQLKETRNSLHRRQQNVTAQSHTEVEQETLEKELSFIQIENSASEKWETLRNTIHCTALATFGKRNTKTQDWFKAKYSVMTQVIEAKRTVLTEYKRSPSQKKSQLLSATRNKAQQTARNCANEY